MNLLIEEIAAMRRMDARDVQQAMQEGLCLTAYKLLSLRCDGTLGPLFINRRMVVSIGKWLEAECFPTKGYAVRTGWHTMPSPRAPHLSERGRVWCEVRIEDFEQYKRPASQGGMWYLAQRMLVVRISKWTWLKP